MKVKIQDIAVYLMDVHNLDYPCVYDTNTGLIEYDFDWDQFESDEDYNEAEERYIPLPESHDVDGYQIMKNYVDSQVDEEIYEWLNNAIHGRGAFRMFRGALERFGLTNDWHAFEEQQYEKLAIEWAEKNGLSYDLDKYIVEDDDELDLDGFMHSDFEKKDIVIQSVQNSVHVVLIQEKNIQNLLYLIEKMYQEVHGLKIHMDLGDLMTYYQKQDAIFALSDNGRYIGFYAVQNHGLLDLYVTQELRRKGYGRMLFHHCLNENPDISIFVRPTNQNGIAFLKHFGYSKINLYKMEKEL